MSVTNIGRWGFLDFQFLHGTFVVRKNGLRVDMHDNFNSFVNLKKLAQVQPKTIYSMTNGTSSNYSNDMTLVSRILRLWVDRNSVAV